MIQKIILIFLSLLLNNIVAADLNLEKINFLNKIDYSINVYNIKTRQSLYKKNTQQKFIPASLTKLVLTAAILDSINSKFRFKTPIYIDNLNPPNLYITGSADPNVTRKQLKNLTKKLKNKKISQINTIILNDSIIIKDVNSNGESARYYYALSGGLNTNYNQIRLHIDSDYENLIASPNSKFVNIELRDVNFKKNSKKPEHPSIKILKRKQSDKFIVNGYISKGDELNKNLKLRISRPTMFFYSEIEEVFKQNKINIANNYVQNKKTPYKKKKIYTIVSKPISSTLIKLNQESDNMIGSLLFKYLGKTLYSEPGTIKKGRKAISSFIEKKIMAGSNIKILDGAGLSRYSFITTDFINNILIYLYKNHFKLIQKCLINISEVAEYKSVEIPKNFNVYVKSGTLSQIGVNNLAGFIENKQTKDVYVFSILTQTKKKIYNPIYKGTHSIPILNEILTQFF